MTRCSFHQRNLGCFSPSQRNGNRAPGFTLLELLVVIMIITILLGQVVPALDGMRGRGLVGVTGRLSQVVNHARQEATLSSRPWRLEIDRDERSFRFHRRQEAEFIQVSRPPFAEERLPPDIEITGLNINGQSVEETGHVYFFPTGEQDTLTLTLIRGEHEQVLYVGPLGPARVESP